MRLWITRPLTEIECQSTPVGHVVVTRGLIAYRVEYYPRNRFSGISRYPEIKRRFATFKAALAFYSAIFKAMHGGEDI